MISDGHDPSMVDELARVSASADFVRAPVMRRLLDFLVHETLAGRGDQLKAYSVAVDGLGRPADFDSQTDSYPRVQVGRLRRMLDAFYAREPHPQGSRFSIPQGRYRVEFATPDIPVEQAETAAPAAPQPPRATRHTAIAGGVIAVLLGLLLVAGLMWPRSSAEATIATPTLALAHLGADPSLDAVEIDADSILLDGLRRSWLVTILPQGAVNAAAADYRLSGDIGGGNAAVIHLRLVSAKGGELLWTGQVPVPANRALLREALDPLIAELIQPYGVIATDQRAHLRVPAPPGYACHLKFDQYRRERTEALHKESQACVAATLANNPGDAMGLAAKAFLTLDDGVYRFAPDTPGARQRSLLLAQRAVRADPYSPFGHIVLARVARHNGGCALAIRSARRAIILNPVDPDLHATSANILFGCGDAGYEAAARRAIALDPTPPANFYTALVFSALERGDMVEARRAATQMAPSPNAMPGYYDFVFAVVAAAENDRPRAHAAWARLLRAQPDAGTHLTNVLHRWSTSPRIEALSLRYLRTVGLVPPADRDASASQSPPDPALRKAT